ncbi:hypothetical protein [Secundilactobacillus folii]|uniref:Uncharacterized protein n=1 Tax=Secundilactobacillus folii TaxID=2678357 RepID=A0A7X2XTT8_9LACO|nr:hypothetical protein [Secundilactobacillus folii]MTV81577.1 hypothetical protein [Secundilactobacillus folii]
MSDGTARNMAAMHEFIPTISSLTAKLSLYTPKSIPEELLISDRIHFAIDLAQ